MAKLFTDHDPYHLHKILGLICLLHYLYRFDHFFRFGQAFGRQDVWVEVGLVALHGVLSASSLLLPLPETRNHDAPMIWKEFRFHSILFANRHVVFTIIYLLDLQGVFDPLWRGVLQDPAAASILCHDFDYTATTLPAFALSVAVKASLLILVCNVADFITGSYGSKAERTTNSMAYPDVVAEADRAVVKTLYAERQFFATIWCVMGSPLLAFAPTFGIQMAPLMMTFVRKGLMGGIWYHRLYAASLQICYYILSALFITGWLREGARFMSVDEAGPMMNGHIVYTVFYGTLTALFTRNFCRFKLRLSPQVCWGLNVVAGVGAYRAAMWFMDHHSSAVVAGTVLAAPASDGRVDEFLPGVVAAHAAFKAWFAAHFVDAATGALKFRALLFTLTLSRTLQITVHTSWMFAEALKVVPVAPCGGWRGFCSGGRFPLSVLFGEREWAVLAALFVAAGFAPTLAHLVQIVGGAGCLAAMAAVAKGRGAASQAKGKVE